jgi:hypothetical protein
MSNASPISKAKGAYFSAANFTLSFFSKLFRCSSLRSRQVPDARNQPDVTERLREVAQEGAGRGVYLFGQESEATAVS